MRRALPLLLLLAAACGSAPGPGSASSDQPRTVVQVRSAADGRLLWQAERPAEERATVPVLADDVLLVNAPGGGVTAYDVSDGHVVWSTQDGVLAGRAVGDLAVVELPGSVEARRLSDGSVVWQRRTTGHVVTSDTRVALLVDPDQPETAGCGSMDNPCPVVPGSADPVTDVAMLDPATGKERWRKQIRGRADSGRAGLVASALVLASSDGTGEAATTYGLDPADGSVLWTRAFTSYVGDITTRQDALAITFGLDDARTEALDPLTGRALWAASGEDTFLFEHPFLDHRQGEGFRRDPATGRELPGRVPFTYGLAAHGDLLVGAAAEQLVAVRGSTTLWTADLLRGPRPLTDIDMDARYVATVSEVGQEEERD